MDVGSLTLCSSSSMPCLKPSYFKIVDVDVPDPLSERRQDARDKSGAKARFEMHQLEKSLIEQVADSRAANEWTILDGEMQGIVH